MANRKEGGFNTRKKASAAAVLNPNKEVIKKKKKKKNTFMNSKFPCFAGTTSKKKTSHTWKKNGSSNNRGGNPITYKPTIDYDPSIFMMNTNTTTTSSNSVVTHDDNFLVFEILTRLQVKSLVRFKSVCRNWYPLIQNNHHNFIDSHLSLSKTRPRLLIVLPIRRNLGRNRIVTCYPPRHKSVFITAALDMFSQDKQITIKLGFDTIRKGGSPYYHEISKPVNGLICLIDTPPECSVRVYNVSTRQLSPWFHSELLNRKEQIHDELDSLRSKYKYRVVNRYYGFGFDPATNVHKLVCLYRCYADPFTYFTICEVLIVGGRHGNKWRIIELPSPYELSNNSIYVNGVIYWSTSSHPYALVAFDVGTDKFRTITVSESMLDHLKFFNVKRYLSHDEKVSLFEVDGRLAMIIRTNTDLFKMYVYEDDEDKEMNRTSSSGSCINNNRRWNEACSLTLPFDLGKNLQVKFSTFVGSHDKIILTCFGHRTRTKNKSSIYCYNWKKGSLTKFDISGIPSSVPPLGIGSFLTTFSESLLPVSDHNISCFPSQ